jgi:cytoskeletal protein CcmA (bactofilin family)
MSLGSRLPRGVVLEGAIRGQGDLRIAGEVEGPIEIDGHLVVEESGVVRGEVRARVITIAGILEGNATALELVRLEPGARMTGDARAERVSAAQGALLRGRVRTSQERAQLERMRRTTGGTLLAPFSSSGAILAPGFASSAGELTAPPAPRPPSNLPSTAGVLRAPAIDSLQAEAAVARVTREAVIDARDPSVVAAQANAHAVRSAERREEREAAPREAAQREAPREARPATRELAPPAPASDRPPPPVMPAIGRRRAQRRNAESAS